MIDHMLYFLKIVKSKPIKIRIDLNKKVHHYYMQPNEIENILPYPLHLILLPNISNKMKFYGFSILQNTSMVSAQIHLSHLYFIPIL